MRLVLFELRIKILSLIKQILTIWRTPLNREQTIQILAKNVVYQYQNSGIEINTYRSLIKDKSELNLNILKTDSSYDKNIIDFEPDYVWHISRNCNFSELQICRSGHPLINRKLILDLDYGTVGAFKEFPVKLKKYDCDLAVAPWSHNFGGYYSFLLLIITKLCRIEAVLGRDIWKQAKLCYPLLHTSYEQQYLNKMGIPEDAIVDTRQLGVAIKPKTLIVANNQTQINRISPNDIQLLRQRFLSDHHNKRKDRKIFLPRRGRRILKNESEIRDLLIEYGFEMIEDIYRTVDEQIDLFNSASVILGVHGAGLANLVWCQPKTKLIELFYSGYTKRGFYYLTKVLNLEYACLFDKSNAQDNFVNQYCDLEIDPILLRNLLDKVLI